MWSHSPANRQWIDWWRGKLRATALALACLCSPCLAAERAPSWLTELASSRIPEYDSEVGAVVLLDEKTVTVEADGKVTTSVRKAIKILTREGRREARGVVIYRTDSGKVRRLRAWTLYPSGATKTHRKRDIIDVSLVEDDVYDVYDESRASVILGEDDADTGSVFGYESVLEDRSVFTQFSFNFQDDLPALLSRFRLELPSGWTAESITDNHRPIEPLVNGSSYSWQLEGLPPVSDEPARPGLRSIVPRVNVSYFPPSAVKAAGPTFRKWSQVSAWLASLADPRAKPDSVVITKAQDLTEGKESEFEKIRAIADFTQRIRYASIQMGIGRGGGYQPSPAPETLQKAYGDCKDKVNLMRSLLAAVGIESYPVVIFSGNRRYVRPDWPSPQQFNHAIIAVKFSEALDAPALASAGQGGELLLFDPTDPYTPLGYLPAHQQDSLALLVRQSGGELLRAPASPPQANLLKRHVTMRLARDGSIGCQIREQLEGSAASRNRRLHRRLGSADYRKRIERWVSRGAPGAAVSRIEAGDRNRVGFFLNVDFTAAGYGRRVGPHLLVFKPAVVSHRALTNLNQTQRKYAVVLEADTYQETVEVDLPLGFTVDEMPAPVDLTTPFGRYRAEWRAEAGNLVFSRHLELGNAVVPPEDYASVKGFFDEMIAADQSPVVLVRQ